MKGTAQIRQKYKQHYIRMCRTLRLKPEGGRLEHASHHCFLIKLVRRKVKVGCTHVAHVVQDY